MKFKNPFRNRINAEDYRDTRTYNYDTAESRVATAEWLFSQAKNERSTREMLWKTYNDYYAFAHDVAKEMAQTTLNDMELPFVPAGIPDPYIMVESQICPDVPQPEFHGRDDGEDSIKAEIRQKAVKYVMEANRINDMNTANERRLRKYGDAYWKAYWDETMMCGQNRGDIRIKDIPVEDIYPDPTAKRLEDCEYVDYVYSMHKFKFWRVFGAELKKQGVELDDIVNNQYRQIGLMEQSQTAASRTDLVQVLEHWYKQPYDGEGFVAGDIACTIQAGGKEIRYIPKYWENTGEQNKSFPFVHYWCIQDETGFYNRSEIEPIIHLVDTADRELAIGVLNDMMMANDIILQEEEALAPGEEITNTPGAVIKVKKGMIGAVARLGGLNSGARSMQTVDWILNQIQRTNRNFDTNNGQEASRVTTASGLLQLRSDAAVQSELKKADRNKGFCRLYELIDWLCLEFYTDERYLFIGADPDDAESEPSKLRYNPQMFTIDTEEVVDQLGNVITPASVYYPRVDVTVTTGDGIGKNPASTVQVLDRLAAVQVTQDNYKLLEAELDYLDIPQKQTICEMWDEKFKNNVPPEIIEALGQNPELLSFVAQQIGNQPQQTQGTSMGAEALTDSTAMPDVPTY